MWFQTASKKQLGDLLERSGGSPSLFDGSEYLPDSPPSNGEFILVWPKRPTPHDTPTAIVVENASRRDLLAWAASFASSYRPLTAHLHVLNLETCTALLERRPKPTERGVAAAVGAILGEGLASAAASSDASVSECARTYSYAMGRTYALGLSGVFEEVTAAWQVFASLTNQSGDKRRDLEHQRRPWAALVNATKGQRVLEDDSAFRDSARVLNELYETGEVSEHTLLSLKDRWPGLEPMLPMLRDTREVRVNAFQRFAEDLAHMPRRYAGDGDMPFVLGYLASKLAPGSLEYFRLLRPLEQHLPGLLVWYGICAALQRDDFVANSGALGRRVQRDLLAAETFPAAPQGDISVWDLELFARSESNPLSILGAGSFDVELIPDVLCIAPGRSRASQSALFDSDIQRLTSTTKAGPPPMSTSELRSLLDELRQALDRVASVQYRLERMTGSSGSAQPPKSRRR